MSTNQTVSFDDEPLILVDSDDHVVGYESKLHTHEGQGLLHRAFSIFLLTTDGQLLLQQRSGSKPLWPLFWSNSCCSHPRRGETYEYATQRRLHEELNLTVALRFIYRFQYQSSYQKCGAESEVCSVYVGVLPTAQVLNVNPNEIAAWQWYPYSDVDQLIATQITPITPWFALEWVRLRSEFHALFV
ncbi:isopentenyl-diphosphate Delta-isomerase [Rhodoferax sp. 4810]|uniref:Isopentenyl-diphosphate Delta-isomerase n=1 Tax=Thiospirillum jenense TaxID=1653858 RepID=A0A839HEH9_9GAMM|nr:isopentenyl-diphosphate Delta-isomerase [Rhodoferax jenense]MBB1126520.1 isopentenyl-diphosphate Delta-isomerase [Thiospirillum jenense]